MTRTPLTTSFLIATTLKGRVDSPAEAATAIANAFQAGAVNVEDELVVDPS